ncbi:MAG: permease, partial [Bacillota bacterium]
EDREREEAALHLPPPEEDRRALWQYALYFATMVLILIFAAWGRPEQAVGFFNVIYEVHWYLTVFFLILLGVILKLWFNKEEMVTWVESTWGFAKQIFPLLLGGVLVAGFLMGRPGYDTGIIPAKYISTWVGGNSLEANFLAAIVGALMYFATLTEVPILQGLLGSGMGQGPALALLLAGPALSLPNMLIIRSIMGTKKALVYISLVVIMATLTGMLFGAIAG